MATLVINGSDMRTNQPATISICKSENGEVVLRVTIKGGPEPVQTVAIAFGRGDAADLKRWL